MFLAHNYSIGFYLRNEKWQAIGRGDYSGAVVHPAIVHMSLLIGGQIYTSLNRKSPLLLDEEVELDRALQALQKRPDPVSLVTVYSLVAWFFFFKRRVQDARTYLAKAYEVVTQYNLTLTSMDLSAYNSGTMDAEPSEDMKEWVTALCEVAYLDKAATLVLKIPQLLPPEFDRQLKQLPVRSFPLFCGMLFVPLRIALNSYGLFFPLSPIAEAPTVAEQALDRRTPLSQCLLPTRSHSPVPLAP